MASRDQPPHRATDSTPPLFCPSCARPLVFREAVTRRSAPSASDWWERYECATCGPYELRCVRPDSIVQPG